MLLPFQGAGIEEGACTQGVASLALGYVLLGFQPVALNGNFVRRNWWLAREGCFEGACIQGVASLALGYALLGLPACKRKRECRAGIFPLNRGKRHFVPENFNICPCRFFDKTGFRGAERESLAAKTGLVATEIGAVAPGCTSRGAGMYTFRLCKWLIINNGKAGMRKRCVSPLFLYKDNKFSASFQIACAVC